MAPKLQSLSSCMMQACLLVSLCSRISGKPVMSPSSFLSPKTLVSFSPPTVFLQPSVYSEDEEFEENDDLPREDVHWRVRRQAVYNKTRLWPGGIVPYMLDEAYTQAIQEKILASMKEIEQSVGNVSHPCVKFVPRTTEINFLDVRLGNSCSSVIGLDYTGPQVSTFSPACALKGILMHELLHTLGLYHEQDRYDRDDYLSFNITNMREDAERDFVKKNSSDIDTLGTPYDFTSIMHYGPYSFAKDLRRPVMTPKPEYSRGLWMGQRNALSHLDVLRVQRLYHCPEDTSHILSDISEDKRLAWCDFEDDVCNMSTSVTSAENVQGMNQEGGLSNGDADTVFWITTLNSTPDGPAAGSTNGLDAFFYASGNYRQLVYTGNSNSTDAYLISDSSTNTREDQQTSEVKTPAASKVNVSLTTQNITTSTGFCCIELRVFQAGPKSFLEMYAKGPYLPRTQTLSLQGTRKNNWATIRQSLALLPGIQFQLELVAVLDLGSVALDDLHVLEGSCQ